MPHTYVQRGALALCLLALSPALHSAAASAPPINIALVMNKPLYSVLDDVKGTMTVTWPNGSRIVSASIQITERPATFGSMFGSTANGPSDSNGQFDFSFAHDGIDYGSNLPGHHDLIVIVTANDITTRQIFGYDVGVLSI